MDNQKVPKFTRRNVISSTAAVTIGAVIPNLWVLRGNASSEMEVILHAASAQRKLDPSFSQPATLWNFNGAVPGPEIRVRQGARLRVTVNNGLAEDTTVHWHGVRTSNAMDGVPYVTQKPISPGNQFVYDFNAIDAGTYWYHPHQRSFEQVGRGLYGPLIIEEANPIRVDRDVTWMLDDWRLEQSGEIEGDFGNSHDMSHSGRIGNTVTINGKKMEMFSVGKGERIRLRLINAANARIFGLDFQGHEPVIIALDGQPVTPHRPNNNLVILGPAMRVDLVLDMVGNSDDINDVVDRFYEGLAYRLTSIKYSDKVVRNSPPNWSVQLPKNPLKEPDFPNAQHHEVLFSGGMMGNMVMREMGINTTTSNSMMGMMYSKNIWFINGVAAEGHIMDPMLNLDLNRSYVISMTNASAWYHPIHLHGHSFRVVSRGGKMTKYQEWQDTVLMAPRETVEIAFVADNPGDWMFHCHILEHQASGMMGVIRVA
ncbi:MAG: multicopper oxidase family protein [Sneathiella sp.]|uniref:multicopper oxidase family protein n=1 Tax=Sneathiella sp. TaxID=1964365 RepID=UPI0030022AC4